MSHPERLIRQKNKKFTELVKNAQWHDLVTTCYAPNAKLAHKEHDCWFNRFRRRA